MADVVLTPQPGSPPEGRANRVRSRRAAVALSFLLLGGFAQLTQILMSRELLVVFFGNEVTLGVFFGSWLFWIGIGGILVSRLSHRFRDPGIAFRAGLALLPAALIVEVAATRLSRAFIEVSPSEFIPFGQVVFWVWVLTLPVSLAVGICFPLGCKVLRERGAIAGLYAVESLGSLVAGVMFTFVLVRWFRTWPVVFLICGLTAAHLALTGGSRRGRVTSAGAAALFLVLLVTPAGGAVERLTARMRWRTLHPKLDLIASIDTPYQNIAIGRLGDQVSVAGDGRIFASFPDPVTPVARAALFYSQNPRARRILLFGGAASGLIPELLRYPVDRVLCVEPDRRAFEAVEATLPEDWRRAYRDPRLEFRFRDGRLFLNRLGAAGTFDLIIASVPDPSTAQANRFYTVEFYRRIRQALTPDGVYVTGVSSASNYLGREVKSYSGSVYHTLRAVFPEVKVTPGDYNYLFAATAPGVVTVDSDELARRYESVPLAPRRFPPQGFATLIPQDRIAYVEEQFARQEVAVNSDLRPLTYYLNMLLWGKMTGTLFVKVLEGMRAVRTGTLLIPLVVFVVLRFFYTLTSTDRDREERSTASVSMAALGFAAMSIQIILLYTYQSLFGFIYQRIGILNGLFMFGLAAGALAGRALLRIGRIPARGWLAAGLGGCAAFALLLPRALGALPGLGPQPLEIAFLCLATVSGIITGAGFPFAIGVHHGARGEAGRTSGAINAADHFGGAVGGLAGGAFLVPLVGIPDTCLLVAAALFLIGLLAVQNLVRAAVRPGFAGVPAAVRAGLAARAYVSFPIPRVSWSLVGIVAAVFWISTVARGTLQAPVTRFADERLTAVSGSSDFEFSEDPFPHYLGRSPGLAGRTLSFSTAPLAPEVRGYAGPLNLLLGLSEEGRVLGVAHVESDETPSYIDGIDTWLQGLKGRDLRRPLRLGDGIDAMTGATISSRAALETINRAGRRGLASIFGTELPAAGEAAGFRWGEFLTTPKVLIVGLFLLAFFPVFFLGRDGPRFLYLIGAVLILGVGYNSLVTMIDIGNLSLGRLPGAGNPFWYLLGGFVLLTSLLWGQVYCGYVCPFGALQEIVWRAGRRAGLKAYPAFWLDRAGRYFKFVLVALVLVLFWITGSTRWISFNPMQYLFSLNWGWIVGTMTLTVLVATLFYFRFWCRYFCPTGAILALFNKIALLQDLAPKRRFQLCDLGVRAEYDVDCIQCSRCIHADRRIGTGRGAVRTAGRETGSP